MAHAQWFTGIWRSRYSYPSSGRDGEFSAEHYVRAYQRGKHVVFESVPDSKSYVVVSLTLQDDLTPDSSRIATGTWQEETAKDDYYKGVTYRGAIHLISQEGDKKLSGKWIGFGKEGDVNDGPWDLTYVGETVPA